MNSNIEIEAKVLLSEEEYNKIIVHFHLDRYPRIKQTNYYIDSETRVLKENGIALRIRESNDFELTLKTPLSEGLLEKNQNITWREYESLEKRGVFPEGQIKSFLEVLGFNIDKLKILASLTTERIEIHYKDGLMSLDRNVYNNQIDYELEMEQTSMDGAEELIKDLLKEVGIEEHAFNHVSKQARAINALTK